MASPFKYRWWTTMQHLEILESPLSNLRQFFGRLRSNLTLQ